MRWHSGGSDRAPALMAKEQPHGATVTYLPQVVLHMPQADPMFSGGPERCSRPESKPSSIDTVKSTDGETQGQSNSATSELSLKERFKQMTPAQIEDLAASLL